MDVETGAAASALADIGHLLESVQRPAEQLERALVLVGRFVPNDCCALLDVCSSPGPALVVAPPVSRERQDVLRGKLRLLHDLVSDNPAHPSGPLVLPGLDTSVARLAVPVIALDEAVGILMVERNAGEYEAHHLQLLSVVAAQLGGYLANVRLQSDEQSAKQARQRAADLLEHIDDGFLEFDHSYACVTANRAAVEMLGVAHGELIGGDIRQMIGIGSACSFVAACERVLRERLSVHLEAEQCGGQHRWFDLELYPTDLGASVFLRDITEKRAADEFRELLTGIVGHDLRTPLSAITVTASTLLAKRGLDAAVARSVARIASSGARMEEMISQLLDLTRIRFGNGLPIQREEADLGQLCRDVVNEVCAANPARDIQCECQASVMGSWDVARLSQAVSNLLGNAVQHGDPHKPVRLSVALGGEDQARVDVHNDGPPISAELLPVLFQPFRQAGGTTARVGSVGLGLFIAQSIVVAHGGTIEVESAPATGTTFSVLLPRRA